MAEHGIRILQVSVTYGRRFNLGAYNALHAEVALTAEVEEGEEIQAVFDRLWELARGQVREQILRIKDRAPSVLPEGENAGV